MVEREGVCWRPVTTRGTPVVGKLTNQGDKEEKGKGDIYIAAGHGAWGISLSLGTGYVMAGMVEGKKGKGELGADVERLGL